jgi:hypothetical protein
MRNNIKIAAFAWLLGMVACGVVDETAPGNPTSTDIGELVEPPDGATGYTCAQVARWIDENRDRLPSSYDEIVRFPEQFRWAIFSAHRPDVRSALFRAQFARFRLRPALTEEQRDVLDRADVLMSPALYAPHDSPAYLATVEMQLDLERRSIAAFGPEETWALMAHLGPPEATTSHSSAPALLPPTCDCNLSSDWCGLLGKKCRAIPCNITILCGTFGSQPCNGVCGAGI